MLKLETILYTDLPMYASYVVLKNCPYVMNGLEDIKAWKLMKTHFVPFLACYSKNNDSIYQHETIFLGKIRYLFLTYQTFVIIFLKYGIFVHAQHSMAYGSIFKW